MTFHSSFFRSLLAGVAMAAALLGGSSLHAQFQVALALDKHVYIAQEAMVATVTITNRSGADVVMGGPDGRKWLVFNMRDALDRSLTPLDLDTEEPVILNAGATIKRKVVLSETHGLQDPGTYSVTASVYHPASGDYYASEHVRFVITDVKPYGQPLVFGVPEGFPGAGRVRRYTLLVNREMENSSLYFRLLDDSTNTKMTTFPLGPVTLVREPQVTMDRKNQLHVMFLTNRDSYIYAIIQPDGRVKKVTYVRESPGNRPQLYLTASNDVVMKGGAVFDPVAEKEQKQQNSKGRSISERPAGL